MPPSSAPLSVPVYQILLSLAGGDAHGYAIIGDVRARTDGDVELTASTLYGALQRMLDEGWIREIDTAEESDGPRRRVYRLTSAGREAATAEAIRLQKAARQAVEVRLLDARTFRERTS